MKYILKRRLLGGFVTETELEVLETTEEQIILKIKGDENIETKR
jgi:hypothetical protein